METWISAVVGAVVGGLVAVAARGWWVALMGVPAVRRRVARACLRAAWWVAGPSLFAAMAEAGAPVEPRWGSGDRGTDFGGVAWTSSPCRPAGRRALTSGFWRRRSAWRCGE